MNFARLVYDAADAHGDRVALREGARHLTFTDLARRASAVAEALIAASVRPGDRVGILLPHGADAAASFFGALAAGAVGININWLYRPRQVEFVLAHSGARVLLASDSWHAMQPRALSINTPIIRMNDIPATGSRTPIAVAHDQPAQIAYTSGSTGAPKGVVSSHRNLWAGVYPVTEYLGVTADDRIASLLPFSFVYGFSQLSCALASGARLDIITTPLPEDVAAALTTLETTLLAAVPPFWMQLLRAPGFQKAIPSLRVLTCAGGRLPTEAVRALRSAQPHARLFLMYGFTEVFRSTFLDPSEVDAHPDSMGRAIAGSRVLVVREDGSECDVGEVGELVHAGPTVALGYLDDPVATDLTFRSITVRDNGSESVVRAARSGDLVRRDAEGRHYYVGRRDRMIKTLGMRVSPDEVVDVLYASGQVAEAVVTSQPDTQRGERIIAHVVLLPTGTLQALRVFAGTELPRHMQPVQWDVRDALPRNASGKHDLQALDGGTDGV